MNDLAQVPWYENALIDDAGENVEHFNEIFLKSWSVMRLSRKGKSEIGNVHF